MQALGENTSDLEGTESTRMVIDDACPLGWMMDKGLEQKRRVASRRDLSLLIYSNGM